MSNNFMKGICSKIKEFTLENKSNLTLLLFFFLFFQGSWFSLKLYNYITLSSDYSHFLLGDSKEYINLALDILKNREYYIDNYWSRPPGYPIVLSIVFWFFEGKNIIAASIFNILFSFFTVLLLYLLVKKLSNNRIALFSSLLLTLSPMFIFYSNTVMTEAIFTTLLIFGLYFYTEYFFLNGKKYYVALSATILGLSVYLKPTALYIVFPLALPLFLIYKGSLYYFFKKYSVFILVFLSIVSPMFIYNYMKSGVITFSTMQGANLYYQTAHKVMQDNMSISSEKSMEMLNSNLNLKNTDSKLKKNSIRGNKAARILLENPLTYLKLVTMNSIQILLHPGKAQLGKVILKNRSHPSVVSTLMGKSDFRLILLTWSVVFYLSICMALFIFGSFFLYKRGRYKLLLLLSLLILYFVFLGAHVDDTPRFRVPVLPLIAIISGYGLYELKHIASKRLLE
ncbi:MAG: ArnT family glycosyltransferase [Candidatus Paceibacteria bacterium]